MHNSRTYVTLCLTAMGEVTVSLLHYKWLFLYSSLIAFPLSFVMIVRA